MLKPYKHELLSNWLSGIMLPEAAAVILQSQQVIVNYYNTTESMDLFNDNLVSQVEQTTTGELVDQLRFSMINRLVDCLTEQGILIDNVVTTNDLELLTAMLRTTMEIDEYGQPLELMRMLELGNPSRELFGEMVNLLYPHIQVEHVMNITKEVLTVFLETITLAIKQAADDQLAIEEDDYREQNHERLLFISKWNTFLHRNQFLVNQGTNHKEVKRVLKEFYNRVVQDTSPDYEDALFDACGELLRIIPAANARLYGLLFGYLVRLIVKYNANINVNEIGQDVPDFEVITDMNERRRFVNAYAQGLNDKVDDLV